MPNFPLFQVDAFTTTPLGGNPCAIVFDADSLDEAAMQAIAREMNLSETAFVRMPRSGDVAARYFTPAEEIPLAGHPTIATMHALVTSGRLPLSGPHTRIRLELKAGDIPIDLYDEPEGLRIVMSQLAPVFGRIHDPAEALAAFSLPPDAALPGAPVQTVSTGTPQLMLPLRDHDALRRAQVDLARYIQLRQHGDFFSPHLFVLGGVTPEGHTFARHFGVPPDIMEDPFTGSATGGMAAYLWHYRLIQSPSFIAEQGHWMGRPGAAQVEVVGPPDAIETVRVGGRAVTVFEGVLRL